MLVLIECKYHKNPIKREVVQVLLDKLRATGAQKGIVFSTVKFQKGAIEFAQAHGIALVMVANGKTMYVTRSANQATASDDLPSYVCWLVRLTGSGDQKLHPLFDDYAPLVESLHL